MNIDGCKICGRTWKALDATAKSEPCPWCALAETQAVFQTIEAAIEPVRCWYDGDGEIDVSLAEIVRLCVDDVQADRKANVDLRRRLMEVQAKLDAAEARVRELEVEKGRYWELKRHVESCTLRRGSCRMCLEFERLEEWIAAIEARKNEEAEKGASDAK